jgi:phage-related minor tail protein
MAEQNVVRTLTVRGISDGLDKVASDLTKVAGAHEKAASASVTAATVTETSAKRQLATASAYDRLRRSVDQAYDAQVRLSKAETLGRRAIAGGADPNEVNRTLELYRQKLTGAASANDNLAKSSGLAAHQAQNLRSQLLDIGTSLSGGASPLMVLSQQGPQVYEALSGPKGFAAGLKDAATSAVGLVSRIPLGVAALGATAAAAGVAALAYARLASNQRDVALGTSGAGRASGTSVSQINRIADASAGNGLSAQSIREMSTEFARTGKIGSEMYADLSRFAKDYAVLTGTDVADATKELAQAFADPVKGAQQLNEVIGGLDGRTQQLIERLAASGDRLGAQRVAMAAFSDAVRAAGENTSVFANAWNAIKADFSGGLDEIGKAIAMAVRGGVDLATQLQTAQKILESSQARKGWMPFPGMGDYDVKVAQAEVDRLRKLDDAQKKLAQDAKDAQKTLAGKGAVASIMPGIGELQQLETFRTQLKEALDTGKAVTGTEDALKRINELLKAGGTEVYNLARGAREAFDLAGLLPFQQALARINNDINERLKTATPQQAKTLEQVRQDQLAAARVGAVDVPLRDANMAIDEQIAKLKVQRDSFLLGAGAAAEMAAKQEMISSLIKGGVKDWENYTGAINAYAKRAGEVAAANDNLQRTQQNIVQGMDEMRSGTQSAVTGMFSAIRQGQNPMQALMQSMGRMTDQFFDRMISKPLTEGLLGQMGKAGGGLFGDDLSKVFGNATGITTPLATVNASVVNVNGGVGAGAGIGGASTQSSSVVGPSGSAVTQVTSIAGRGASTSLPTAGVTQAGLPNPGTEPLQLTVRPSDQPSLAGQPFPRLPTLPNVSSSAESVAGLRTRMGGFADDPYEQSLVNSHILGEKISQAGEATAGALTDTASGLGQTGSDLIGAVGSLSKGLGGGGGGLSLPSFGGSTPALEDFGGGTTFFADGGVMTSRGRLPLNRYAKGGVANSPQVAMFGEGRGPEAYVPLPDGRSIPVSMKVPASTNANAPAPNISLRMDAPTINSAEGVKPAEWEAAHQRAVADAVKMVQRNFGKMGRAYDMRAA